MSWGVFITSKVEHGYGSIVQTVFVKITEEQKSSYLKHLLRLAEPLCDWLYDVDKIERGYLREDDRQVWLTDKQWKVLKSRFKIWSALHRRVKDDGPFDPLGALKHVSQLDYNKGKWGLDKCTENYHKISFTAVNLSLETKYVIRMFDGVVGNIWKFIQGRKHVRPLVELRKRRGQPSPTTTQIRTISHKLPLKDFV